MRTSLNKYPDGEAAFPTGAITPYSCITNITESISASNISLYPSPAHTTVTVSVSNAISGTIKVSNVLGKTVMNQKVSSLDSYELTISQLESGIYFMEINTENGTVTKKFIKE